MKISGKTMRLIRKYGGGGNPALLALCAPLFISAAEAGYSVGSHNGCSLDAQEFVSVTIGNIMKAPEITVPVNMTCNFTTTADPYLKNPDYGFAYCWHYHNIPVLFTYRSVGPKGFKPDAPKGSYINYNFYGHDGLKVAGLGSMAMGQFNMIGWAKGSGYKWHMRDHVRMVFEGNEGRHLTPGIYNISSTTDFHGNMSAMLTDLTIDSHNPYPWCNPSKATPKSNDITSYPDILTAPIITIKVMTYCNMSVKNEATFPVSPSLRDVKPITATLNVDCSAGTHYQVDSDMGRHSVGNQRYMKGANSKATIAYNIDSVNSRSPNYIPDSAEPLRNWTDYGNGTLAGINYDIQFSIVPGQKTPIDDTYKDTIVYTVTRIPESGDITSGYNNPDAFALK